MHRIDLATGALTVIGEPVSVPAEPTFVGMWTFP
jgi:hypothetical protein